MVSLKEKAIVYIHGKGGNAEEVQHYRALFPTCDLYGFDYCSVYPWEAKEEFPRYFQPLLERYQEVSIIANSLGAYLSMEALAELPLKKAFFISPIVDMKALILGMMKQDDISRERLQEEKEMVSSFGEVISWNYLSYVESHDSSWSIPTAILYGDQDFFTSRMQMESIAQRLGASLTIMEGGEHWFHTDEQMAFLDNWILKA